MTVRKVVADGLILQGDRKTKGAPKDITAMFAHEHIHSSSRVTWMMACVFDQGRISSEKVLNEKKWGRGRFLEASSPLIRSFAYMSSFF